MSKVSIVSAWYNRAAMVEASVGSLLNQDYNDYEVIIINDGSMDDTAAALDAINDPRLRVIHQDNAGFTTAIARAVDEATGEYIAVHGSGDVSLPQRLSRQAAVLDKMSDVGVVGCHVQQVKGDKESVFTPENDLPFFETLCTRNLFLHGEVMFRKSEYERAGGYRSFFTFGQDRDLWLRMALLCDYHVVSEVLYRREDPAGAVSRNVDKQTLQAYLSAFSVECAHERKRTGKDMLDRYGGAGALLRGHSSELARRLVNFGVRQMLEGHDDKARSLLLRAIREDISKKTLAGMAAWGASHHPLTRKHVALHLCERLA